MRYGLLLVADHFARELAHVVGEDDVRRPLAHVRRELARRLDAA